MQTNSKQNILKVSENNFIHLGKITQASYDDIGAKLCMEGNKCEYYTKEYMQQDYESLKLKIDNINQYYEKQKKLAEAKYNFKMKKYSSNGWF